MKIRIKKNADGSTAFTCTRADGTATWQRHQGPNARFFPYHDLTHYAVETTLGFRRAFYGLVAEGWDLSDFGAPWPRGPLPVAEAEPAERIVGFLDGERATGNTYAAADLGDRITTRVTDAQLAAIRARMQELFAQWHAVPFGEAIDLDWDA